MLPCKHLIISLLLICVGITNAYADTWSTDSGWAIKNNNKFFAIGTWGIYNYDIGTKDAATFNSDTSNFNYVFFDKTSAVKSFMSSKVISVTPFHPWHFSEGLDSTNTRVDHYTGIGSLATDIQVAPYDYIYIPKTDSTKENTWNIVGFNRMNDISNNISSMESYIYEKVYESRGNLISNSIDNYIWYIMGEPDTGRAGWFWYSNILEAIRDRADNDEHLTYIDLGGNITGNRYFYEENYNNEHENPLTSLPVGTSEGLSNMEGASYLLGGIDSYNYSFNGINTWWCNDSTGVFKRYTNAQIDSIAQVFDNPKTDEDNDIDDIYKLCYENVKRTAAYYNNSSDIIGVNSYRVFREYPRLAGKVVDAIKDPNGCGADKPVWLWFKTGDMVDASSYNKVCCQVYTSIAHGATGVLFYSAGCNETNWNYVTALAYSLSDQEDIITGEVLAQGTCGEDIHYSIRISTTDQQPYLIATNTSSSSQTIYIDTIPGAAGLSIPAHGAIVRKCECLNIDGNLTINDELRLDGTDVYVSGTLTLGDGAVLAVDQGPVNLVVQPGGTLNTTTSSYTLSGFHNISIAGTANFSNNLTVAAGDSMQVSGTLRMGTGKNINVYGNLNLSGTIAKMSGGSNWGQFIIHDGATLSLGASPTIRDCTSISLYETTIFNGITLQLGPEVDINLYNQLKISSANITKIPSGSEWGRMNIYNGGELWVAGPSTIEYSDDWTINVYNGGILDIDSVLTVKNSLCGITIETGSDFQKDRNICLHIEDCVTGFRVYENTDLIENVVFERCTRAMYIQGSSSNPQLDYISVRDQETYGMIVSTNSNAYLSRSIIGQGTTATWPYNTWLYSGAFLNLVWRNDLDPRADGYAINLAAGADNVLATQNYWGDPNPIWANILSDPNRVNYSYYSSVPYGYGAFKFAGSDDSDLLTLLEKSADKERSQNWADAEAMYHEILATTDDTTIRRSALMSLLRVIDHSTKDYSNFRNMIQKEIKTCAKTQRPMYDNLLCELYVREGKYQEAANAYEQLFNKYGETETGVEILTRLAKLYGDTFRDKAKAKAYADRAAHINPGQLSLEIAYGAADVKYDPFEYTDAFRNRAQYPEELPDDTEKDITEFISNSPNPFNPYTTFNYAITNPGMVELSVYSITGQKIATLVDDWMDAGTHSVRFEGRDLASGIYIYQFTSPGFRDTGRMLLVK